jgi:hypothetical protein
MTIQAIHSYLVHPSKHVKEQPGIGGTSVGSTGRLFDMLKELYDKSDAECNFEISFNHNAAGEQQNDCRDLLVAYARTPSLSAGRALAERLQGFTNQKSGLGLLFIIAGKQGRETKLLISRFPADSGILAEEDEQALSVQFLEKVFMKNSHAYKAALYRGTSFSSQFWDGNAVDKQINSSILTISNYWIRDFLASDFRTTAAAGTRRLAVALRTAMKKTNDLSVKAEITAGAQLASSITGRATSIQDFVTRFGLSDAAKEVIKSELRNEQLFTERFTFSKAEFAKHIAFRSVELSNGGILTAEADAFDNVFERHDVDAQAQVVRYVTQGRIVDERLKGGR